MPRGRTANPAAEAADVELNTEALAAAGTALTVLSEEALRIQQAFGLDSMDPTVLESELRSWVEATSRSMFNVGTRLIALRTVCLHGEWLPLLDRVGIAPRAAQRFMAATMRCLDTGGGVRERLVSLQRSKLFELVALDDGQLDELEQTGRIAQLALDFDDIDRMSVSQLRGRLREVEQTSAARQKLIDTKDRTINTLAERLEHPYKASESSAAKTAEQQALLDAIQAAAIGAQMHLLQLAAIFTDLENSNASDGLQAAAQANIQYLAQILAETLQERGIAVDFTEMVEPAWLKAANAKMAAKKAAAAKA